MRHVITGGSGFTGAHLCDALLARGERPLVLDLREPRSRFLGRVDFIQGDLRSSDLAGLGFRASDIVYHLAARQFLDGVPRRIADQPAWFADVNVGGTARLLAAMERGGARRLVFFSTDMTYGVPDSTPVQVSHPQRPVGPYGASKLAAERLILECIDRAVLEATIFRPRLIAGAGRLGILSKLFALIEHGLPVPMIGSGRNRYQMIAVEDCVAAALRTADLGCPRGPFNLGSDDPPDVRRLLRALIQRAGSRSIVLQTPATAVKTILAGLAAVGRPLLHAEQYRIADVDYMLDTRTTQAALGWRPRRGDADILFDAFADFRERRRATAAVAHA